MRTLYVMPQNSLKIHVNRNVRDDFNSRAWYPFTWFEFCLSNSVSAWILSAVIFLLSPSVLSRSSPSSFPFTNSVPPCSPDLFQHSEVIYFLFCACQRQLSFVHSSCSCLILHRINNFLHCLPSSSCPDYISHLILIWKSCFSTPPGSYCSLLWMT